MTSTLQEKRRFPRLDTSKNDEWKIRVFGVKGRPLEGQILNLSVGGVAFTSHWKNVAKAVKRFNTKVEIYLPDGYSVTTSSSLVRIRPKPESDQCICVLALSDLNKKSSNRIQNFIPN